MVCKKYCLFYNFLPTYTFAIDFREHLILDKTPSKMSRGRNKEMQRYLHVALPRIMYTRPLPHAKKLYSREKFGIHVYARKSRPRDNCQG